MFQTWWDINKQNVRKAVDALSGAAAGWLIAQGETWALFAPFVVMAANYAWFWFDNKNKVTVQGLKAEGEATVAQEVKSALDAKK